MSTPRLFSYLKSLFRRRRTEDDLSEELQFHLQNETEKNIAVGMTPEEARHAALRSFGGVEQVKELCRDERGARLLEECLQDIRYGFRMLRKNPGFTVVAVLTLALGIGANTGIFSIVNALLIKSLPVNQPEQLVLYGDGSSWGFSSPPSGKWNIFSYPLYQHLRDHQASFQDVAAFRTQIDRLSVRPSGSEIGQLAWGKLVSGSYFSVLGVKAAVGRELLPEDEHPAAVPVAVLSFDYWSRRFQRSASVVGQVMNMNGVLVTVVGVAPAEFFGESLESEVADLWLPLTLQPRIMRRQSVLEDSEQCWLNLIARLQPGISITQAQADVNVTFQQFLAQRAGAIPTFDQQEEMRRSYVELTPGASGVSVLRTRYSQPLHILLALVGFVLLITCANVANLLLSRAAARHKEMSMRLALGASRNRLLRQLLTESLLLAGLGGALGVSLSSWMIRLLLGGISTGDQTVPLSVSPDFRVLGFTMTVCLLTGILFGLAPAVRATRADVWPALKGLTSPGRGRLRWGLGQTFVVVQVGLSLPLLVGGALFVQTLRQLRSQDFGFRHQQVLEVGIEPSVAGYQPDQLEALYGRLLDRVNSMSGVSVASLSLYSPMSGNNWQGGVVVEGYTPPPRQSAFTQWVWVGPRYAEAAGMRLLSGRDFGQQDTQNSRKVAIVNDSFVRRYLSGRNPIGRQFSLREEKIEIVGVVADFKFNDPRQDFRPVAFMPLIQSSIPPARYARFLEVRTLGDPVGLAAGLREVIRQVDPNLPVTSIKTLTRQVDEALARESLIAGLSSFFAVLGLLLACVGLYGVLAYAVTCQTREIGVRMALGAQRRDVLWLVLKKTLALTLVGIHVGLALALSSTRLIASLLFGLTPTDVTTLCSATLVMASVALLAGYFPARRASRVDAIVALRHE